jgi:hypothetical protein
MVLAGRSRVLMGRGDEVERVNPRARLSTEYPADR